MLAWEPFVPAVTVPQLKFVSVFASVSVTRLPGVSAYTVTVAPDATAAMRSRAVLPRLRLIAAARLAAVPPVEVMVIDVVWPDVGSPVKVPTTLARVFPVEASTGKTTKSAVQLGAAFTLKENLAGDMPCATPPAPSEMAQSFLRGRLECLRGIGVGRQRTRPEPGAFPCRSHWA